MTTPFTLAFEQAERELGEEIGYPALVYEETETGPIAGDEVAELRSELARRNADVLALRSDNAGLLAILREIDYAEPARAEQLLTSAREQEHPGRALMARTTEELYSLHEQLAQARAQIEKLTQAGIKACDAIDWELNVCDEAPDKYLVNAYIALLDALGDAVLPPTPPAQAWLDAAKKAASV